MGRPSKRHPPPATQAKTIPFSTRLHPFPNSHAPPRRSPFGLSPPHPLRFRLHVTHWLIKSEPDVFSIHDLARVRREAWTGVRNYQARNFMWHVMKPGDPALFYHSNAKPPGIAGLAKVASAPYPDPTQFDPASEYFDPKATPEKPRWWLVDFAHTATFTQLLTLEDLKTHPTLQHMQVCQRGTRLSITPVDPSHFALACQLAGHRA